MSKDFGTFLSIYRSIDDSLRRLVSADSLEQSLRSRYSFFLNFFKSSNLNHYAISCADLTDAEVFSLFNDRLYLFKSIQLLVNAALDSDLPPSLLSIIRSFITALLSPNSGDSIIYSLSSHLSELLNNIKTINESDPKKALIKEFVCGEAERTVETLFLICSTFTIKTREVSLVISKSSEISPHFDPFVSNFSSKNFTATETHLFNTSILYLFTCIKLFSVSSSFFEFSREDVLNVEEIPNPLFGLSYQESKDCFKFLENQSILNSHYHVILSLSCLLFLRCADYEADLSNLIVLSKPEDLLAKNPFNSLCLVLSSQWLGNETCWNLFSCQELPKSLFFTEIQSLLFSVLESFLTTTALVCGKELLEFKQVSIQQVTSEHELILGDFLRVLGISYSKVPDSISNLLVKEADPEFLCSFFKSIADSPSLLIFQRILEFYQNLVSSNNPDALVFTIQQLSSNHSHIVSLPRFASIFSAFRKELADSELEPSEDDTSPLVSILKFLSAAFRYSKGHLDGYVYENNIISHLISFLYLNFSNSVICLVLDCLASLAVHATFAKSILTEMTSSSTFLTFWQSKLAEESKVLYYDVSLSIISLIYNLLSNSEILSNILTFNFGILITFLRDSFFSRMEMRAISDGNHKLALYKNSLAVIVLLVNSAVETISKINDKSVKRINDGEVLPQAFDSLLTLVSDSVFFKAFLTCMTSSIEILNQNIPTVSKRDLYGTIYFGLKLIGLGNSVSDQMSKLLDLLRSSQESQSFSSSKSFLTGFLPSFCVGLPILIHRSEKGRLLIFLLFSLLRNPYLSSLSCKILSSLLYHITDFSKIFAALNGDQLNAITSALSFSLSRDLSNQILINDLSPSPPLFFAPPLAHPSVLSTNSSQFFTAFLINLGLSLRRNDSTFSNLLALDQEIPKSQIFDEIFILLEHFYLISRSPFFYFQLLSIISNSCIVATRSFSRLFPVRAFFLSDLFSNVVGFINTIESCYALSPLLDLISFEIFITAQNSESVNDIQLSSVQKLVSFLIGSRHLFELLTLSDDLSSSLPDSHLNYLSSFTFTYTKCIETIALCYDSIYKDNRINSSEEFLNFLIYVISSVLNSIIVSKSPKILADLLVSLFQIIENFKLNIPLAIIIPWSCQLAQILVTKAIHASALCRISLVFTTLFSYIKSILTGNQSDLIRVESEIVKSIKSSSSRISDTLLGIFKTSSVIGQLECLTFLSILINDKVMTSLSNLIASELLSDANSLSLIFPHSSSLLPSTSFTTTSPSSLVNQLALYESKCALLIALSNQSKSHVIYELGVLSTLTSQIISLFSSFSTVVLFSNSPLIDENITQSDFYLRIFISFFRVLTAFVGQSKGTIISDLAYHFFNGIHTLPSCSLLITSSHVTDAGLQFATCYYELLSITIGIRDKSLQAVPKLRPLVEAAKNDLVQLFNANLIQSRLFENSDKFLVETEDPNIDFYLEIPYTLEYLRGILSFLSQIHAQASRSTEEFSQQFRILFKPNFEDNGDGFGLLGNYLNQLSKFRNKICESLSRQDYLEHLNTLFGIDLISSIQRIKILNDVCCEFLLYFVWSHAFIYSSSPSLISSETTPTRVLNEFRSEFKRVFASVLEWTRRNNLSEFSSHLANTLIKMFP
ncbi:hypothetical protein RCL1_004703 [Eukaryota sp. TZLM3-RCL]